MISRDRYAMPKACNILLFLDVYGLINPLDHKHDLVWLGRGGGGDVAFGLLSA